MFTPIQRRLMRYIAADPIAFTYTVFFAPFKSLFRLLTRLATANALSDLICSCSSTLWL
ncbi:hypothetical protein PgNI_11267 [Pyricularia grisea]|uniref:Uncharacterized protein n=1 Tax=Pyricularia grisea TaxID=148305 RepID=A0A6P8AQ61_PYRGI|nr:hypothetical protein PgNI_11267 [Pyricularia grisea]TLD04158.1 hypothetical protein PgNI_11267 [Pyricularia grisea]